MIIELFSLLVALFVLFLPAYFLTSLFLKKPLQRFFLALPLTYLLVIFIVILLNFFTISSLSLSLSYLLLILVLFLLALHQKKISFNFNLFFKRIIQPQTLLVLAALVFVFIFTFSIHFDYHFPFHVDEWVNLTQSLSIMRTGHLSYTNIFQAYHFGFNLFTASLFLLARVNPFFSYQFLPAVFAALSSFILFSVIKTITKKFWPALLAIFLFASLKTNLNLLGIKLFVSFVFLIPLLYLIAYYLHQQRFFLASLCLLAIIPIQGTLFLFILFSILIWVIFTNHRFRKLLKTPPFLLSFIIIFFFVFFILSWLNQKVGFNLLTKLIFPFTQNPAHLYFNLPLMYGAVATLLLFYGLFICYRKKWFSWLSFYFFFTLLLSFFPLLFQFSPLLRYQRVVYQLMLSAIPFSALGLYYLSSQFYHHFKKVNRLVTFLMLALLFFLIFYTSFLDLTEPSIQLREYVSLSDYQVGLWLLKNHPQQTIFTSIEKSLLLPALNLNSSVHFIPSENAPPDTADVINFFSQNCSVKKNILNQRHASVIISNKPLNCSFLDLIYEHHTDLVYSFNLSDDNSLNN